jgi:hypothetical protein
MQRRQMLLGPAVLDPVFECQGGVASSTVRM